MSIDTDKELLEKMLEYYKNKSIQLENQIVMDRIKDQQKEREYKSHINDLVLKHTKEKSDWIYKTKNKYNQKINPTPSETDKIAKKVKK